MKNDSEIISLILEKEDAFVKEVSGLVNQISSDRLTDDLKEYLNGLTDLRNDFLSFCEENEDDEVYESTLWADRYWYFERT